MLAFVQSKDFRQCKMKRERVTEEVFTQKLRMRFKSSQHTNVACSLLCCQDDRCYGILVCSGVCHLFGDADVVASSVPDYNSCDLYNVVQPDRKTVRRTELVENTQPQRI